MPDHLRVIGNGSVPSFVHDLSHPFISETFKGQAGHVDYFTVTSAIASMHDVANVDVPDSCWLLYPDYRPRSAYEAAKRDCFNCLLSLHVVGGRA